ncbi:MAG: sodium-dependent transporter [Deltaproteobacteria bacterium]|nr:sodium-dependent transporter [Deltaproteobacteria bacterium]
MGPRKRETWKTRLGLVLAMAGSAVGLGNYLRFPVQAAQNGGGAFMIPYFCALIFLAMPLMWCEWAMGRMGGEKHHGTTPGIFALLWKHPAAKYIGAIGVLLPLAVSFYYVYIQSWTLAYSFFALTGKYAGITSREGMSQFLSAYQGIDSAWGVSGLAYLFFLLSMVLNTWIHYGGIQKGIERAANWGMPVLILLSVLLTIRVLTLGSPDPVHPENSVWNGIGFIWNPDLSQLRNAKVWLAAAGQVFFTLSVGFGMIHVYASYMKSRDDVVVTGFSTTMVNEWGEVILGGTIAIPIAYAFFGPQGTLEVAQGGAFNLGFATMPVVLQQLPWQTALGTAWFFLLFIAGTLSQISLTLPLITFLEDELDWDHKKAVLTTSLLVFLAAHIPILGLRHGALDEIDFWAGTFAVSLFALVETILFIWVFRPQRAWAEIHKGAQVTIPKFFLFVLKFITPTYLLILFLVWSIQQGPAVLRMDGVSPADIPWRWGARLLLVTFLGILLLLIQKVWSKRKEGV